MYKSGQSIAGYNLAQMITYVSVGWIIRSFYWNTIDQEIAYEVLEGKITMDLIKPVSIPWMWISRAIGESAFRLGLLTLPTAVVVGFIFHVQAPSSRENFLLFMVAVLGRFFLKWRALNFMIGTCAIPLTSTSGAHPREILADRAAFGCADSHELFPLRARENSGVPAV